MSAEIHKNLTEDIKSYKKQYFKDHKEDLKKRNMFCMWMYIWNME